MAGDFCFNMIPTSDLRKGTYVLCGKTPSVVQEIMASGISFDSLDGDIACGHCEHKDVHPIIITEDWLGKLGFKELYEGSATKILEVLYESNPLFPCRIELTVDSEVGINVLGMCILKVPVKYIHHIQNLYYTLTGTELKIKE
jgi:hypothetical protein